jgi:hypothetical protein
MERRVKDSLISFFPIEVPAAASHKLLKWLGPEGFALAAGELVYCVTQNDDYSWRSTLPIVGQLGKLRPIANRLGAFSR